MVYDRLDAVHESRALEAGHPPFAGAFALGAGIGLVQEIGINKIANRIDDLTSLIHQRLTTEGYAIASPDHQGTRSGITLVSVRNAKTVAQELMRRDVFISHIDDYLRVSLHFYNNEDDVETFVAQLRDVAEPAVGDASDS